MTIDVNTLSQWRLGLTGEIDDLRRQIAPVEEAIRRKEEELSAVNSLLALQGTFSEEPTQTRPRPRGRLRKAFVEAAVEGLRRQGEPLHYRALYARLLDEKAHIPGRDPAANLLAHMSRDDRFTRMGRGTYGLSEWGATRKPKRKPRRRKSRR